MEIPMPAAAELPEADIEEDFDDADLDTSDTEAVEVFDIDEAMKIDVEDDEL
jgi:hypothetical protein